MINMGFMDVFKSRKAVKLHQNGRYDEALAIYEEVYEKGLVSAVYMLPYSVLLLKRGEGEANFLKVKEILKKAEKAPDLTPDKRQQLLMN